MQYRKLGRTGLEVSAIALGCEGFIGRSEAEAKEMFATATDAGVNFMDMYSSDPEMRSLVGRMFDGRMDFHIQGHLCSVWQDGQYKRSRNIKEVKEAFDDLMRRLNRDRLDVGMIHYVDSLDDWNVIWNGPVIDYARELKANGRIGCIGLSSHNPVVARQAIQTGEIDVLLFSINPAYDMLPPDEDVMRLFEKSTFKEARHNFNPELVSLYEMCEREGVGIDVMKAFGGGNLLDVKLSPLGSALTPVQCLNYALTRPGVAAVMCGCHNVDELKECLAWCEADEKAKDYSVALSGQNKFTWSGQCMYCGHCAPCPKGIKVAEVNKFLNLAASHAEVPETIREHYAALPHHASECVKCGACEKRCPFQVPVRQKMAEATARFGI